MIPRAAARRYLDLGGIRDRVERVDIVAFAHAVAANLGEDDSRNAPLRDAAHERVAIDRRPFLPAVRGDLRSARVDAGDDLAGKAARRCGARAARLRRAACRG